MKTNSIIRRNEISAIVVLILGFFSIVAQAQTDVPVFKGNFTLSSEVLWGKSVLQPGNYTITVGSSHTPNSILVRSNSGHAVVILVTAIDGVRTGDKNALLITPKNGQLCVYSLVLSDLGRTLIYDPALARQAALQARAPQTVPVTWARR
jgi:hypothetical protein